MLQILERIFCSVQTLFPHVRPPMRPRRPRRLVPLPMLVLLLVLRDDAAVARARRPVPVPRARDHDLDAVRARLQPAARLRPACRRSATARSSASAPTPSACCSCACWRQPLVRPRRRGRWSRRCSARWSARFISHRRGIYYALLTIAFGQVFWFVAVKWHSGHRRRGRPAQHQAAAGRLRLRASTCEQRGAVLLLPRRCSRWSLVVLWRLVHSPFGRVLERDQAERDARRVRRLQRLALQVAAPSRISARASPGWPARCSRWRSSRPIRT